jgi:hypothetical protein
MEDLNMLPPAPKEIQGMDIKIEYISLLAQAQKMIGLTGIERVAGFVGNMAAVNPDIVDKFDFDQAVDEYAETVGINPGLVRSDDKVAEIRAQRDEMTRKTQLAQFGMAGANASKTLSQAKMTSDGKTALDRVMGE